MMRWRLMNCGAGGWWTAALVAGEPQCSPLVNRGAGGPGATLRASLALAAAWAASNIRRPKAATNAASTVRFDPPCQPVE